MSQALRVVVLRVLPRWSRLLTGAFLHRVGLAVPIAGLPAWSASVWVWPPPEARGPSSGLIGWLVVPTWSPLAPSVIVVAHVPLAGAESRLLPRSTIEVPDSPAQETSPAAASIRSLPRLSEPPRAVTFTPLVGFWPEPVESSKVLFSTVPCALPTASPPASRPPSLVNVLLVTLSVEAGCPDAEPT